MLVFADSGEAGVGNYLYEETTQAGAHPSSTNAFEGAFGFVGIGGGAFWARKTFSTTYTELYFSFWVKITSSVTCQLLSWWTSATELGSVRWNSTNKHLEIYTSTGTLRTTGTATIQPETLGGGWFNLNIRVLLHASTGVIDVRYNGDTSSDAIYTGNTLPSGSNMNQFLIGSFATGTPQTYDSLWVNDTSGGINDSWPGAVRASTQFPTGKSATNDAWTADSGSNKFDRINEQAASAANYIFSDNTGDKQGFTYAAPPFVGTIKALVVSDIPLKISAGGIKQGVRSGGTDYPSSSKSVLTALGRGVQLQHYLDQNPNGPATWTTSDNPETYLEKTA